MGRMDRTETLPRQSSSEGFPLRDASTPLRSAQHDKYETARLRGAAKLNRAPGRSAAEARLLWEQEVASSILAAPTSFKNEGGLITDAMATRLVPRGGAVRRARAQRLQRRRPHSDSCPASAADGNPGLCADRNARAGADGYADSGTHGDTYAHAHADSNANPCACADGNGHACS